MKLYSVTDVVMNHQNNATVTNFLISFLYDMQQCTYQFQTHCFVLKN